MLLRRPSWRVECGRALLLRLHCRHEAHFGEQFPLRGTPEELRIILDENVMWEGHCIQGS